MRPPAANHNPPNRASAHQTRLSRAQVHPVLKLEEPPLPVRIHIVRNGRPAQTDSMPQNLHQLPAQPLQLRPAQPSCRPARPDPRPEKALVGVDVPHSRQQCLVQQRGLDREAPAPKQRREILSPDGERFSARRGKSRIPVQIPKLQPAEPPRINKPQLPAA